MLSVLGDLGEQVPVEAGGELTEGNEPAEGWGISADIAGIRY